MKNFVLLILVFVFGVIISASVSAQEPIAEAPPSVETLIHQEGSSVTVSNLSESCENCTGSSRMATVFNMPAKFVQRIVCSSPVQRISQAPSRFGRWVQCNRPVRSTMRSAACRLRCR